MLKLDFCEYSDVYIVVKGKINPLADASNENDKAQKNVMFENNARFTSCISKISNTFINKAEDLDIMMSMYNLECSDNYSMT